ncbi:MAG: transposase [Pseudomonadota bacterium]|nr:transposase [Pseudomonadota bacterium]
MGEQGALAARHGDVRTGRSGVPCTHNDLSAAYQLPLQAIQGLIASVLNLLKAGLPVPAYTTLC